MYCILSINQDEKSAQRGREDMKLIFTYVEKQCNAHCWTKYFTLHAQSPLLACVITSWSFHCWTAMPHIANASFPGP